MSTEQSYEPELVDQTRQQIRGLVREIEALTRAEISPEEFYEGFLHRVVAALAAIGGAVWTLDEEGQLLLSSHVNLAETRLHESQEAQQRHGKLLRKVLANGEGTVVLPGQGGEEGGNPTDFLLVLGILRSDQEIRGVVEIFQRTGNRPAVERGYLRFVSQMCDLADDYLKTRQLRLFTDRQAIWSQLEQFTRTVHSSLDTRLAAYSIANEGRRLIECDRVSLAIRKGRKCRIEAVSGQEIFDKRSNTVALLGELATVVVRAGEPLWYTGETRDLPPQIEQAVEAYVDESHSKTVIVLPLAKPRHDSDAQPVHAKPEYIGALIVERINTDGVPSTMRRRIDVVADHGSTALANALEHQNLFLMPLWRTLGKSKVAVSAKHLPKTLIAAGVLVVFLLSLFLIPADFRLHGNGTLEPAVKREIYAQVDGQVVEVRVADGDEVKANDLLIQLTNPDLDKELVRIQGEIAANLQEIRSRERMRRDPQLSPADKENISGQLLQLQAKGQSLEEQRRLYVAKRDKLSIRSPIDGKVVGWQLRDLLINRPVDRGQKLLTIVDPKKDWELEVHMPEDRMGHIKRAQNELNNSQAAGAPPKKLSVKYILATNPGQELIGELREVHGAAEVHGEDGNTVLLRVAIDEQDLGDEIRPGATVSAKVLCGQRSLGYVWFHDVLEFIQSKILFRW